ncbi:MAG: hypothetical protein ABI039_14020 [Vicinamibacterales bacterium]
MPLLVMLSVPVTAAVEFSAPATDAGEKTSVMVQVAEGATEVQLLVWANCEVETDTALMVSVAVPVLVTVTVRGADVVPIDWPPKSTDVGLGDATAGFAVNVAVTVVAALIVTVQPPVPLQPPPDQPTKAEPEAADAVSVTNAPELKFAPQVDPQSMPAGEDVTVPAPAPVLLTVSAKVAGFTTWLSTLEVLAR